MHLDLDCVESFLVLVQERHYGRAAARLHLSSPTLSKRVQRLERQLKVRLLERGPSGVLALTPAGARLASDAVPLLEYERTARRSAQERATAVTLGIPHDGGSGGVTKQALTEVRRLLRLENPDIELICRKTPLPLVTAWLLEGQVDVQLTAGAVRHRTVRSTPLAAVSRVAAVSTRSDLRDAVQVQVDDLVELPMLFDPGLPEEFMRPFWLGDVRPATQARLVGIVARNGRAVMEEVSRSTGVTVLLAAQAGGVPAGVHVLPLLGVPPIVLHAARRIADRRTAVRSLVEALQTAPLARG